jgi:hypothetical protein
MVTWAAAMSAHYDAVGVLSMNTTARRTAAGATYPGPGICAAGHGRVRETGTAQPQSSWGQP